MLSKPKEKVEEPEQISLREVMEYYGYKGLIGTLKYYFRFLFSWLFQVLGQICPHPGLAVVLQGMRGVKIGKHVFMGRGIYIDDLYPHLVTIEDYTSIGMDTMIFVHSHAGYSLELKLKYYPRIVKPTTIKRGAWVAPGCIILPGVTIAENSVVGAGSVATRDTEPYTVNAGNPAKLVKRLEHQN